MTSKMVPMVTLRKALKKPTLPTLSPGAGRTYSCDLK
jgi:hypothetical protein